MYTLETDPNGKNLAVVCGNTCIPFAPANMDYIRFKADLANNVTLNDSTGNVMTSQAVAEFLATLP